MENKEKIEEAARLLQKAAGILEEIAEDELYYYDQTPRTFFLHAEMNRVQFIADMRRYGDKLIRLSESLAAIKPPVS